jgi:hypothetical protein
MLNNLSLDMLGEACTEIEEAKDMVRAQRLLYQRLEEAAVGNARDGVEHTKRSYTG